MLNVTRASSPSQDFVTALSILLRGTVHEKLRWTFNLYDINKDGHIHKEVGGPGRAARKAPGEPRGSPPRADAVWRAGVCSGPRQPAPAKVRVALDLTPPPRLTPPPPGTWGQGRGWPSHAGLLGVPDAEGKVVGHHPKV